MARIPYAEPDEARSACPELVDRIIAERGSMLHLYAMLLQSPPMAEGWLALMTAIRQKGVLPGSLRELMIMRVAWLNDAPYEAEQHRPIALREGLREDQVDAIRDWQEGGPFDAAQIAALAYCDAMTRDVHVADAVFDALRPHFDAREITELTITIAGYNMVSRVLEALRIASSDGMGDWA